MTNLSVNLNKVALLRNQRDLPYPSVVEMADTAVKAGAAGITVHPRPDERHIRRSDVLELNAYLDAKTDGSIEYNVEGNPTPDFVDLVLGIGPTQVTLVPDAPDAKTSDHGWNIAANETFLTNVVSRFRADGLRVALFVDPDPEAIRQAHKVGADRIEIYTEPYANAYGTDTRDEVLALYRDCAEIARDLGLGVNAGHDLSLENLPTLIQTIPWILEVSIGHALTADALRFGFATSVTKYLDAIQAGSCIRLAAQ